VECANLRRVIQFPTGGLRPRSVYYCSHTISPSLSVGESSDGRRGSAVICITIWVEEAPLGPQKDDVKFYD
jgi:hypothetical protein